MTKEIQQLKVISRDQQENISSLKEVSEVVRAADALEAETKLSIWKKTYEIGLNEISRNINTGKKLENDYITVIEERAVRDKDVMRNLLEYSEQFKEELQEASTT